MSKQLCALAACACLILLAGCGEDEESHTYVNEDGDQLELFGGFFHNADPETGEYLTDTCTIGTIGASYSVFVTSEVVSFSFTETATRQLEGGSWINEIAMVVDESEIEGFDVGAEYFATVFLWKHQ